MTSCSTTSKPSTAEADFGELEVCKVTEPDTDKVLEFLISDFIRNEPHTAALNFTAEEARPIFMDLAIAGIESNTTYALKNEKNEFVALRITFVRDRPVPEKAEKPILNSEGISDKAKKICDLVERLEEKIWEKLDQRIRRLLYLSIISCRSDYLRRGLAYKLMHYKIDEAKEMGCQGWISEATAYNSQKMFEKLGFVTLFELKDKDFVDANRQQIFRCKPPTDSCKLVFKPF